jgi:transcription elongation factor Elf1
MGILGDIYDAVRPKMDATFTCPYCGTFQEVDHYLGAEHEVECYRCHRAVYMYRDARVDPVPGEFTTEVTRADCRDYATEARQELTGVMIRSMKNAVDMKCEMCGHQLPYRALRVHHIYEVHLADGDIDVNDPGNLVVLCSVCHDLAHEGFIADNELYEIISKRSVIVKTSINNIFRT